MPTTLKEQREKMIKHLKTKVVPELKKMGFKGTFPHFKMIRGEMGVTSTIQFNRYGGSFILEFGRDKLSELNEFVQAAPMERLKTGWMRNRYRLGSPAKGEDGTWFNYENFTDDKQYDLLAEEVRQKLFLARNFLKSGHIAGI
jgi:hypothetical protein